MAQKEDKKSGRVVPPEVQAAVDAAREARQSAASTPVRADSTAVVAEMNHIEFGSPRHEKMISSGYDGLTRKKAEKIIKEREEDPHLWPYEKYEQAQAFLAALDGVPKVTAPQDRWVRDEVQ